MTLQLSTIAPKVFVHDGKAVTTSIAVARYFIKRHERVLDKIRNLECSPEFTEHNFVLSEYTDSTGRKLPMYEMTKDGFVFLVMGFTGKKAAAFIGILTPLQNLSHTDRTRTYMRPTAPDSFAAFLCLQYGVSTDKDRVERRNTIPEREICPELHVRL